MCLSEVAHPARAERASRLDWDLSVFCDCRADLALLLLVSRPHPARVFLPLITRNMIQAGLIPNAHSDLVTDAAYDFFGLRLATCSLDQKFVSVRS